MIREEVVEQWEKAVAFHGHKCPGLALGVRVCEYARELLNIDRAEDEQLVCVAETDSCTVDAIQVLLGCTFGKGNLLCHAVGKSAYSFYRRSDGASIRIVARRNEKSFTQAARQQYILEAPLEELFTFTAVKEPMPETARIFRSVTCALCGESMAEHMARLQGGQIVCLHCFRSYDR